MNNCLAMIKSMLPVRSTLAAVMLLFSTVSTSLAAGSSVTPSTLYQKALTSDLKFSYVGRQFITTYHDDGRSEDYVTDVEHRAPDQFKIVYESPARDAGRVIIEDNSQQWTYLPRSSVVIHSRQMVPLTRKQVSAKYALLKQNYFVTVDPVSTRIADRKVFRLLIFPKVGGGTVSRLWIDPDTGLVLRKEQYHADGALNSVMYFSELKLGAVTDRSAFSLSSIKRNHLRMVELRTPGEQVIKRGDVFRYFGRGAIVPEQIDEFRLQSLAVMREEKKSTLHLRYSDGLVSLSLFETLRTSRLPSTVAHSKAVKLEMPAPGRVVQKYSYNVLNWDSRRYNYTLVGDVRVDKLTELAESLRSQI